MNQTPQEFKKLADSAELYDQSEAIGAKFDLHIDQIGELDAEIRDILNGVSDSADFSAHIMSRLEINRKMADEIVVEVNKAVFQVLRDRMQSDQNTNTTDATPSVTPQMNNSTLEKVGNFNIEKEPRTQEVRVTSSDRGAILAHLENPPGQGSTTSAESHTEPLVDHLLQSPIALSAHMQHTTPPPDNLPVVEETPVARKLPDISSIKTSAAPTPPAPRTGPDPYREIA